MKIEMGKKYTCDGAPARLYAFDGSGPYSVHGAYLHDGQWRSVAWSEAGESSYWPRLNLVEVKEERMGWVNCYGDGHGVCHTSRAMADDAALEGRTACVEIIYYDGDGL